VPQVWVEVEDNENCAYSPLQVFEGRGPESFAETLTIPELSRRQGAHVATGWSSDGGGSPCPVRYVIVSDSGAGVSLLVAGGDYGLRLRPASASGPWRLGDPAQFGEAYLLLPPDVPVRPGDSQAP
jgi:hypothetical protein